MAKLDGELWRHNLARVIVIDTTNDYALNCSPMPIDCYPVVAETYLPAAGLDSRVHKLQIVPGFLYDWHEKAGPEDGTWVIGMVRRDLNPS